MTIGEAAIVFVSGFAVGALVSGAWVWTGTAELKRKCRRMEIRIERLRHALKGLDDATKH